jgi:prevent-host-death family protein
MASLPKPSPKETERVGIREFRQNIAKYVLETDAPVILTRHGDEVGYFIPLRRPKRTQEEREALRDDATRLQKMLAEKGLDGDQIVAEFARWRKSQRNQ